MFWQEDVLIAILLEQFAGIDEEYRGICLRTLLQHDDAGGYAHTKEEIGRQLDDRIHKVMLDEILTNLLLVASTIQHARELNDSCRASL